MNKVEMDEDGSLDLREIGGAGDIDAEAQRWPARASFDDVVEIVTSLDSTAYGRWSSDHLRRLFCAQERLRGSASPSSRRQGPRLRADFRGPRARGVDARTAGKHGRGSSFRPEPASLLPSTRELSSRRGPGWEFDTKPPRYRFSRESSTPKPTRDQFLLTVAACFGLGLGFAPAIRPAHACSCIEAGFWDLELASVDGDGEVAAQTELRARWGSLTTDAGGPILSLRDRIALERIQ